MYQSHSNTNKVLPIQTCYYVIYLSSFLENTLGILSENKHVAHVFINEYKKTIFKKLQPRTF